jgi:enoyl-CoA hydratase/carnithine racemase
MSYEHIEYSKHEGIAEVRLDRPDKLNAFHTPMTEEIIQALRSAMDDSTVYVIILTGNGKGFCSGADVGGMGDSIPDRIPAALDLWRVQYVVQLLYNEPKPTIAAVNGPAIGAGCDFALACDLRVMADESYLREQFVNIGMVPGDGGGWFLPRLIGESKAKELLLTGKDITPEMASNFGLATTVVSRDELDAEALELAETLREKPATALRRTKELIDSMQTFEEYAQKAIEFQWEAMNDEEHDEAISALREERAPNYDRLY